MQIHNVLSAAQRARASDALDAIVTNLQECRPVAKPPAGQRLFALENGQGGVETLRVRLGNGQMRVHVAIRVGSRALRASFVEHLREGRSADPTTMAQAGRRLSEWRRYVEDVTSDDELRDFRKKRSLVVEAAVGAATMLDPRWQTLRIAPAFDLKPPFMFLGAPSVRKSIFSASDAGGGSLGTMSDGLVHALSVMSDLLFVTTSKPTSNPGIQIEFGPLNGIELVNDLSPLDIMHAMRHAGSLGLTLNP